MNRLGVVPVALLWFAPLAASMLAAVAGPADWPALMGHPQLWPALWLALWTGTAALILSLAGALVVVTAIHGTNLWKWLAPLAGSFLSVPHLAFAIGFGFLIAPAGLIARLVAGGSVPPQWISAQDPLGLSLIACLVLKESPFLIWLVWALVARSDISFALAQQLRSARSLGHGSLSIWMRVLIPQIVARLRWPLLIVWVYGASVVDMALVIGPTQPPTLAVIVYGDLNDADPAINARGAAGALFLTLALAAIAMLVWLAGRPLRPISRIFLTRGPSRIAMGRAPGMALLSAFTFIYMLVLIVLALMSIAGHWPYPNLLPERATAAAWHQLAADPEPLHTSLVLASATSGSAIVLAILWFETIPEKLDKVITLAALAALALPGLFVVSGQYRLYLGIGLSATASGLYLAHLAFVFAYVFIVLKGPYRAFDPRYRAVALGLNTSASRFWFTIKAPLLKPALLAATAVGFAVSIAQFLPAQLIASGRFSTLPMEAISLAAGGSRVLTATFAIALAVPAALAFLVASSLGRSRWGPAWR